MDKNYSENPNTQGNNDNDMYGCRKNWLEGVKRHFSNVGFAYFIFFLVYYGVQMFMGVFANGLFSAGVIKIENKELAAVVLFALQFVPTYIISFPVLYTLVRKIKVTPVKQAHMTASGLTTTVVIVGFLMYGGNIVGRMLMEFISIIMGTTLSNSVDQLASGGNFLAVAIFAVILAPVFEEMCFRKILLDRTLVYGERNAVILSALSFGLFHANLYQFFYAFLIGVVFAYIYTRTGKIRYSIGFHMAVNFTGSIIPMLVMKNLDMEKLASKDPAVVLEQIQTPGFKIYMVYVCCILAVFIAGLVSFIRVMRNKTISLDANGAPMTKEEGKNVTYKNIGMSLFIGICIATTILLMVAQAIVV